jgi:hypothetical protein
MRELLCVFVVLVSALHVHAVVPKKGDIADSELCKARKCENGVCVVKNGIAMCQCADGWIGITCAQKDVQPKSKAPAGAVCCLSCLIPGWAPSPPLRCPTCLVSSDVQHRHDVRDVRHARQRLRLVLVQRVVSGRRRVRPIQRRDVQRAVGAARRRLLHRPLRAEQLQHVCGQSRRLRLVWMYVARRSSLAYYHGPPLIVL